MFIICPKCFAKYKLPCNIDLKEGQKLKCSACGLIFEKGQEAPFVLENPIPRKTSMEVDERPLNNPPPEWTKPDSAGLDKKTQESLDGDVFNTPMFSHAAAMSNQEAAGLNVLPASLDRPCDVIPEAFVPVGEKDKKNLKKGSLFLVVVYLLAIVVFCGAAWHYREMLMPAFYSFMPPPAKERFVPPVVKINKVKADVASVSEDGKMIPKTPAETTGNRLVKKQEKGQNQSIQIEPKKSSDSSGPQVKQNDVLQERAVPVAVAPVPLATVNPAETELNLGQNKGELVQKNTFNQQSDERINSEPLSEQQPIKGHSMTDSSNVPSNAETKADTTPLFDVVTDPVPTALESELIVQNVRFQVFPDEQGKSQLLIEGTLHNTAAEKRSVPVLKATVWDVNSQILGQKKVHVTQDQIEAGQVISFYTSFTPAPEGVSHVDVTF